MPLLRLTSLSNEAERYVIATNLIKTEIVSILILERRRERSHEVVCEVPILIAETKNTTCRKLSDILIVCLCSEVRIDVTCVELFVQLLEIHLSCICCVVVNDLRILHACVDVNDAATIVRITVEEHRSVL